MNVKCFAVVAYGYPQIAATPFFRIGDPLWRFALPNGQSEMPRESRFQHEEVLRSIVDRQKTTGGVAPSATFDRSTITESSQIDCKLSGV